MGRWRAIAEGETLPVGARVAVNPLLRCGPCYACKHGYRHVCATLHVAGIDCDGGSAEYAEAPLHIVCPLPPTWPCGGACLSRRAAPNAKRQRTLGSETIDAKRCWVIDAILGAADGAGVQSTVAEAQKRARGSGSSRMFASTTMSVA